MAVTTEIWGEITEPWRESGTIIAQEGFRWATRWVTGKPYIITKIYDDSDNLIGIYCDVSTPVLRVDDGFECHDMYLDVWQAPGSSPVILDEDELLDALNANYIAKRDADDAAQAANILVSTLNSDTNELIF